jgi:hypothetical protein
MENPGSVKSTPLLVLVLLGAADSRAADYHVATDGADNANGTATHPFRTIQKGIDSASQSGGTVIVSPGVYREELSVRSRRAAGPPIVIKAARQQAAILDGAQRVEGWRLLDGQQQVWGKEFGNQAPYNNDHGRWDMAPRSEQVFVGDRRCAHVKDDTAYAAMPDYSFTATRSDPARYALKLPPGLDPNRARTEITVQPSLLSVRADNVAIDGLIFRRVRNTYQQSMVTLHGEGIELRNCLLEYSSAGSGLAIQTHQARIHDNTFRHNGQFGFATGGTENLIENNLVSGNDLAGYKDWGTGGTKIVGNGNILRHNRFLDNLGGVAIWLDCGPANNVIQYNDVSGNYGIGILAEISFHNYIGYNIVRNTKPCTVTMFGRTYTHCIGIGVQNSAETCVVNNFLKDNLDVGIKLSAYNRKAGDLPQWQERHADQRQRHWLQRSWAAQVIYANDNLIANNVVVQDSPQATGDCVALTGQLNGQSPQCYGNQIDYNFYWNTLTHLPKVRFRNVQEVPRGTSQWQTRLGMDTHSLGGFAPQDYRQAAFETDHPYRPTAAFAGIGRGKDLRGLPWPAAVDYLGNSAGAGHKPSVGHIEYGGK